MTNLNMIYNNEIMCDKCSSYYTPETLIDTMFLCPVCKRLDNKKKYERTKYKHMQTHLTEVYQNSLITNTRDIQDEFTIIYFLYGRKTELTKIGYTTNFYQRLYDIRTSCPDSLEILGCLNAPKYLERQIHDVLSPYRHHGEWFETPVWLKKWIRKYGYIPKRKINEM